MAKYFIAFDGMDGSGKSEMVVRLHSHIFFQHKSFQILTTREPSDSPFGKKIRMMLREEADPRQSAEIMLDLFLKDRKAHLDGTIHPFLDGPGDRIVICDRYTYSTIAFQQAQGLDRKKLIEANKKFKKPDLAFILDLPPDVALKRMKGRRREKFEQQEFMNELRGKFLELKGLEDNIVFIDASKSTQDVFEDVKKEVDSFLKQHRAF